MLKDKGYISDDNSQYWENLKSTIDREATISCSKYSVFIGERGMVIDGSLAFLYDSYIINEKNYDNN